MIKNYLCVGLLALFCAFSITEISAQDKKTSKKVIVIEKTIGDDGTVTETKVIKEGEEAEKYMNEMNITLDEVHEGNHDVKDGEHSEETVIKRRAYRIKKTDDVGGNEEVIEWNGDGEIPEDLKKMLEEKGVHLDGSSGYKMLHKEDKDGKEIKIEVHSGVMSEESEDMMEAEHITMFFNDDHKQNKAQLGVMIRENEAGVLVDEVVEESSAAEAGILEGDVITKLNDLKVSSIEELMEQMSQFNPGDKIRVSIIRDGEKTYKDVVLKPYNQSVSKSRVRVINLEEDENDEGVEEEIIIIKKKKK